MKKLLSMILVIAMLSSSAVCGYADNTDEAAISNENSENTDAAGITAAPAIMSLSALDRAAEVSQEKETTDYYVVEMNPDGSDPVYILLTDENSLKNDDGSRTFNEELKDSGKTYEEISKESEETTYYRITEEKTDVDELKAGDTYSFSPDRDIEAGQILEQPPEGGAILEYTGDGKTSDYPSYMSVSDIFKGDIEMVEQALGTIEFTNLCVSAQSAEDTYDAAAVFLADEYGYENVESADDYIYAVASQVYEYWPEDYDSLESCIAEEKEYFESYADYIYDYYSQFTSKDITVYNALLDEMKSVDSDDESAILDYLGMTENEVKSMKESMECSNTPVVKNSGIVSVVAPGAGFDDCTEGVIFYREDLGWSYACKYGGVGFGDASGLHLYSVEEIALDKDAFTIEAGDDVQLNEDGTGVAGLKNVKVTVKLPDSTTTQLVSFDFQDDEVNIDDPHVTAILGGRYYTVTLNLKQWQENKDEEIPVVIEPVEESSGGSEQTAVYYIPRTSDTNETLAELSERMNAGDFSDIVKDAEYKDEPYISQASLVSNVLTITAKVDVDNTEIRRLVLDEDIIGKLTDLCVRKIVFNVGSCVLTIDAGQFKGLSDVVITIEPVSGTVTITVGGIDRTSDFEFEYKVNTET